MSKRKLIARNIPTQAYVIQDVSYTEAGEHCQNCNQRIHYVAIVEPKNKLIAEIVGDPLSYRIGMDCAETLTEAENWQIYQALIVQVKKVLQDLHNYGKHVELMKRGAELSSKWNTRFQCYVISIPGTSKTKPRSYTISRENFDKLYSGVTARIHELGGRVEVSIVLGKNAFG